MTLCEKNATRVVYFTSTSLLELLSQVTPQCMIGFCNEVGFIAEFSAKFHAYAFCGGDASVLISTSRLHKFELFVVNTEFVSMILIGLDIKIN
jgi:hypothetical protein